MSINELKTMVENTRFRKWKAPKIFRLMVSLHFIHFENRPRGLIPMAIFTFHSNLDETAKFSI